MPVKTHTKDYQKHDLKIDYTIELQEMPEVKIDRITITGRVHPSWVELEESEVEKFDKHEADIKEMIKQCEAYIERSPEDVRKKKAFSIGKVIPLESGAG